VTARRFFSDIAQTPALDTHQLLPAVTKLVRHLEQSAAGP